MYRKFLRTRVFTVFAPIFILTLRCELNGRRNVCVVWRESAGRFGDVVLDWQSRCVLVPSKWTQSLCDQQCFIGRGFSVVLAVDEECRLRWRLERIKQITYILGHTEWQQRMEIQMDVRSDQSLYSSKIKAMDCFLMLGISFLIVPRWFTAVKSEDVLRRAWISFTFSTWNNSLGTSSRPISSELIWI